MFNADLRLFVSIFKFVEKYLVLFVLMQYKTNSSCV